jgi:ribosomal-protein-alanine N-acetyltransferase
LVKSDFSQSHRVIMLGWDRGHLPGKNPRPGITIRPMNLDDLAAVEKVDENSFTPVWQNSIDSLELAFRQAAIATVAEDQGKLVGYQISTATPLGGHLARLAVQPRSQGKGIGYALVYDLLSQFERRGARTVTVNTQQDNRASLSLYQKAGFRFTGEEYPVYQFSFD